MRTAATTKSKLLPLGKGTHLSTARTSHAVLCTSKYQAPEAEREVVKIRTSVLVLGLPDLRLSGSGRDQLHQLKLSTHEPDGNGARALSHDFGSFLEVKGYFTGTFGYSLTFIS